MRREDRPDRPIPHSPRWPPKPGGRPMLSRSRTRPPPWPGPRPGRPVHAGPWRSAMAQVPGRDAFAREPKTPLETWEVANYLIRIGQPDQAAPYLKKFLDGNPDDATMLEVRDKYGVGSILALSDDPETRPYAADGRPPGPGVDPDRDRPGPDRQVDPGLSKVERGAGLRRRAAPRGRPVRHPALAQGARASPGSTPRVRTSLAENLGRLDRNAVPALIAALDSTDTNLVGDVARALGEIGDPRAIPALTYLAARTKPAQLRQGRSGDPGDPTS